MNPLLYNLQLYVEILKNLRLDELKKNIIHQENSVKNLDIVKNLGFRVETALMKAIARSIFRRPTTMLQQKNVLFMNSGAPS